MKRMLHAIALPLLGGLTFLALGSVSAARQDVTTGVDPHLDRARVIYDVSSWPIGASHAGYDLSGLTVTGYVGDAVEGEDGRVIRRFRHSESDELAFHVELEVRDTARGAHETLLRWISYVSANMLVPTGLREDLDAGDRSYVGPSKVGVDRPLWYAFVRGNIAVRLTAHDRSEAGAPALVDLARRIDDAIRAQTVLAAGVSLPRPVIESFRCDVSECDEGAVIPVELEATDPGGREVVPRFVVGGSGLGYVERDRAGRWCLHTTGPGTVLLSVEVMGSTGTFASAGEPLVLVVHDA